MFIIFEEGGRGIPMTSASVGFFEKPMVTWTFLESPVPIEHHPTTRYMVYNGYYKVMSNIPKMGQLPSPHSYKLVYNPH